MMPGCNRGELTTCQARKTTSPALRWAGGLLAATMLTTASLAQAQTAGTPPEADATPAAEQDIIVTATKQSQSIQKVPAAVFAISGEDLRAQGVSDLRSIQTIVPGLSIGLSGENNSINYRGIGQSLTGPNVNGGVGINLNGALLSRQLVASAFYDLENVQSLPGPQGTLYGTNSIGGIINLQTKRPANENEGYLQIEGGNYDFLHVTGALNLAISDTLAVRVAGDIARHDGYYSNGLNDLASQSGRVTVALHPSTDFDSTLYVNYFRARGQGTGGTNRPYYSDDPYFFPINLDDFPHSSGIGGAVSMTRRKDSSWVISDETNVHLTDDITLTYIPSYTHVSIDYPLLYSSIYLGIGERSDQHTQELRLAGTSGALKWLAGFYFYNLDGNSTSTFVLPLGGGVFVETGPVAAYSERTYAGFGQGTYAVLPGLRVTGGLRYSSNRKTAESSAPTTVLAGGFEIPQPTALAPFVAKTWNHLDWKVGVEADVAARSLAYASVQTGFLNGGFGFAPLQPGSSQLFQPEKLTGYTVGLKNRLLDNRLTLNVEGFYYDYRDFQVSLITGQGFTLYRNVGKAEVYGVSADGALRLGDTTLDASATWLHAVATSFDLGTLGNFTGFTLPNSPWFTGTVGLTHVWRLRGRGALTARARVSVSSSEWTTFDHTPQTRNPAYSKSDVSLTYTTPDDRWEISAFGRNLEDSATFKFGISGAIPGPAAVVLEAPRTYGARVGVKF